MLVRGLHDLEFLEAQRCVWLNVDRVKAILREAQRPVLKKDRIVKGMQIVDFRGSGMEKNAVWQVKGARDVVESLFGGDLGSAEEDLRRHPAEEY